jgi:hypothetical protein
MIICTGRPSARPPRRRIVATGVGRVEPEDAGHAADLDEARAAASGRRHPARRSRAHGLVDDGERLRHAEVVVQGGGERLGTSAATSGACRGARGALLERADALEGGLGLVEGRRGDVEARAVVRGAERVAHDERVVSRRTSRRAELPSDFDIFWSPTVTRPLCTQ